MSNKFSSILLLTLFAVSGAILPGGSCAASPWQDDLQDPPAKEAPKPDAEKTEEPKKDAPKPDEKANEKPKPKIIAIVGADIHTVSKEVIRSGTLLIEGSKIKAVGNGIAIPDGAEVIDAKGKQISPGFVAIDMSGIGLSGGGGPNSNNADSLDPFDRNITLALGVGITTGCVAADVGGRRRGRRAEDVFLGLEPDNQALQAELDSRELDFGVAESLCPCCGLPILPTDPITDPPPRDITPAGSAVIKMSFGSIDGMLVKESVFYDLAPGSLAGSLNQHTWRQQIAKANQYLKDVAAHEAAIKEGKRQNPPRKSVSDELISLVKGEVRLRVSASSASEIRAMIALSKELGYKLALSNVVEGWLVGDLLAENDVYVTITPRTRRQARKGEDETSGSLFEMPRVLQESGVPFAVTPLANAISLNGLAGRDLTSLPLEAAFAVRGGASEAEALRAVTLTPAKMMGLDASIGSIEVGKDADLLILDGAPLDYRTYVETAIVNGKVVYRRAEDRAYPVFERSF
jgi:imidazolonepropionase-like amidohydrolase